MWFCSLGSGSRGNAHVVCDEKTVLLFDCGFKLPTLKKRLAQQSLTPLQINALFISHEHKDHAIGIDGIQKNTHASIYMSVGTGRALKCDKSIRYLQSEETVVIGDFKVTPLMVPHDSAEPMQFIIHHKDKKLAILTDTGHITNAIVRAVKGSDGLIIESNYDATMLAQGKYPQVLQKRISGSYGHLSNAEAAELLQKTKTDNPHRKIIGAHISQENNTAELVFQALQTADKDAQVIAASQDIPTSWLQLQ